ncbi:MAG TPA: divalent metal cation transporter [Candidatus Dormibacteraeota bacterium]|nr:divalent metal cation transporter [Candidatus Dormibacteraeota bacterium]
MRAKQAPVASADGGVAPVLERRHARAGWRLRRPGLLALGPGLIAGASDNDPTTVATMVVVGATTRYSLSWLTLLLYPLLGGVLVIAAQVGQASRSGLLGTVSRLYGRRLGVLLLVSVVVVNLITLGADLQAGAAAIGLLLGVELRWLVLPYTALLIGMLLVGRHRGVERVLKYTVAIFAAYFFAAFLARPDWGAVIRSTLTPALSLRSEYVESGLAILGTTLTSYCYVWEVQREAAEARLASRSRRRCARLEAGLSMLVAVVTFWFILIASGATLGMHHQVAMTAQDAAAGLQPLAGPLASHLFALGLLSSSLIAVPVLADCSAQLVGEQARWEHSPGLGPTQAPAFYGATVLAIVVGAVIALLGLPPIQLLYWASIAGGLATPIGLVLLLLVAGDSRAMGRSRVGKSLLALGWTAAVVIAVVSALFLSQQIRGLLPVPA